MGSDGSKCRFDRLDSSDQIHHCLSTAVGLFVPFILQRLRWKHYIFCANKVCLMLCKSVCSCVWVNNPFLCSDSAFTRRWNEHHSWYHTLLAASIISCTCFSAVLIVSLIIQEVNLSTCPLQCRLSQAFVKSAKRFEKHFFLKTRLVPVNVNSLLTQMNQSNRIRTHVEFIWLVNWLVNKSATVLIHN